MASAVCECVVFGSGFVGTVQIAHLLKHGHRVVAVDPVAEKVALLNDGRPPVPEDDDGWLARAAREGRFRAVRKADEALQTCDYVFVCVGTPQTSAGRADLTAVETVMQEIGTALRFRRKPVGIILRSTVPPGTSARILRYLKRTVPTGTFALHFVPEFMREGHGLEDMDNPSLAVRAPLIGQPPVLRGNFVVLEYEDAELLKYTCNAWHALKVSFANEIGALASAVGADPVLVMKAFCIDKRLNTSAAYLKPGAPYGGPCLPKDVSALQHIASSAGLDVPLLRAVSVANEAHLTRLAARIARTRQKAFHVLGRGFKPDSDDERDSPAVWLEERLIRMGMEAVPIENAEVVILNHGAFYSGPAMVFDLTDV